jgi:hypothetical protein
MDETRKGKMDEESKVRSSKRRICKSSTEVINFMADLSRSLGAGGDFVQGENVFLARYFLCSSSFSCSEIVKLIK